MKPLSGSIQASRTQKRYRTEFTIYTLPLIINKRPPLHSSN